MQPNIRTTNRTSGGQLIATTAQVTGTFTSIDINDAAKFNVLTGNVSGVANSSIGLATQIAAGMTIDGLFTAIALHSGTVIAYNK